MISKILIVLFIAVYAVICLQIVVEMWVLKDTTKEDAWYIRLMEFFARFFGFLSMREKMKLPEQIGRSPEITYEKSRNDYLDSINILLNPSKILNQRLEDQKIPNWRLYLISATIGALFSLVWGFFGIQYHKKCKESKEDYEKRIKNQMAQCLVIASLIICMPFVMLYLYLLFNKT